MTNLTRWTCVVAFLLGFLTSSVLAAGPGQPLDTASRKALSDTQQMMTNPTERQKALDADPRAKAMDEAARKAVGDENAADVYALAADMMGSLTEESGGDPVKMMELLQQAQKNPEILEKKLTPEQRAKLKAISNRVPASVGTAQTQPK